MNLHNAICKRDNTSSGKIKFSININFLSGSIILASTVYDDNFLSDSDSRTQSNPMESPTLRIRYRIVARIPTRIHRFDGNSHKIRSDSYRIRVGPVVGVDLLGSNLTYSANIFSTAFKLSE